MPDDIRIRTRNEARAVGKVLRGVLLARVPELPVVFQRRAHPTGRIADIFLLRQRLKHLPDARFPVSLNPRLHC